MHVIVLTMVGDFYHHDCSYSCMDSSKYQKSVWKEAVEGIMCESPYECSDTFIEVMSACSLKRDPK